VSRIKTLGVVVSDSLLCAFTQVVGTPESPDTLALIPGMMSLGLQMQSFQGRVLHLQQIICICEEVQVIVNIVALEGLRVTEDARGVLTSFVDSDTLIGDEVANKAEDYD
jgi:hypothetical protein